MKLISKLIKGGAVITQNKNTTKYEYKVFSNLSVIVVFNTEKKSLKLSIKGKSFERQLMYIIFN